MPTTLGKALVNRELPEEFQTDTTLDLSAANEVLAQIANKYPERYRDISKALMQLGAETTYTEGTTLRLSDTLAPLDKQPLLDLVKTQTRKITASDMSDADKQQALEGVYTEVQNELKKQTYAAALAQGNPFALQVKSKARGSPAQLLALMTTPGIYEDSEGRIIPTFVKLRPSSRCGTPAISASNSVQPRMRCW
jgi:hypothetical protein